MNEQSIISQNEIIVVFISHNYMVTIFIILQVKEWLCLNCQMQRAPEPTVVKPGTTKLPPPASPKKQDTGGVVAEDNASAKQEGKPNLADSKQTTSEAQIQKNVLPAKSDQPSKSESSKQDSDFFSFGFGGSRSRSPSPQPTVSFVSGKVLGFGSSFLSSASNLISSAVQDEPSKTPPTSRKGSTVSQTSNKTTPTPPTSRKESVAPQDTKLNLTAAKSNPTLSPTQEQKKPPDAQSSKPLQAQVKEEHPRTCPLCKETLKKDPQNYSSCTSCKSIVCNLCGFNPTPHQTEVSLCFTLIISHNKDSRFATRNDSVFGFGSSILSSASNLISSAVQDESSTKTPPTSRKGSTVSQTLNKTTPTPPTSRKGSVAPQDAKQNPPEGESKPVVTTILEPKPVQKTSDPNLAKPPHAPEELPKTCPLCKETLKKDPQNYSSCSSCQKIVCNLCGFNPNPHQTEVRESLNGMEPQGPPKMKTHEQPENVSTSAPHPRTESITPGAPSLVSTVVPNVAETQKKEIQTAAILDKTKTPVSVDVQKKESVSASPQPLETNIKVQPASSKKKETSDSKRDKETDTLLEESDKSPEKYAPPPQAEPPKQESRFFGFGFSGPKVQPASSKPSESTTGKLFGFGGLTETARSRSPSPQSVSAVSGKVLGFGSSIFSSASNLISSASGKSTTAPASPKGSVASAKATPPTSRKGSVATEPKKVLPEKENKPPVEKKPEQHNEAKVSRIPTSEKDKPETGQDKLVKDPESAPQPSTCPLCKVNLNMGSKDPPNYNTCTECKSVVCHLCGFNPMPHLAEVEWLCLNCQTQRALADQLGDMGKIPISSPKDKSTVTSKIQLPETPAPAQTTIPKSEPKPSPGKQAEEEKTNSTTVAKAAVTTPVVPASLSVKEDIYTQPAIEGQQKDVVVQMDSSLPEMSKVDTLKADIKEQHKKDILPVSVESYSSAEEELKEIQRVSEMGIKETATKLLPVRAPDSVKQYHEDSSESEPSPQIQRRRVRPASSSSEDYKLDSSNSGDDEEFIRRQLIHMGEDGNLPSDEEKHREEQHSQQETREVEKSDDSMRPKRALKKLTVEPEEISDITLSSHDQDDQVAQVIPVSEALEEIRVEIDLSNDNEKIIATDTTAVAIIQKTPVRQTMEEHESLTEDSSKGDGSSSVQVSSITPGTASPTSVSSIDEDSDSSPSHKKAREESKQQRKAKHRPHGQALPTIEDSSEEDELHEEGEQMKQEDERDDQPQLRKIKKKLKAERADLGMQRRRDHLPKTDKLRQAAGMEEWKSSSSSEFSPSFESEPENAEYRTLSSETHDAAEKPLKTAEEVYEEMMQKAQEYKTSEKFTPPDIEPLYGGMLIEDYAYETLVEEQEQAATALGKVTQEQDLRKMSEHESVRILMTPDEAYEEMMNKRSKIMQKEKEAQQAHATKIDTSLPLDVSDTCYVSISGNYALSTDKNAKPLLETEDAYEERLKTQNDVLTPGTSPTPSTPVSPASPLTVSESSYDSPEVILIPSSGEEDNLAEPIECILEPYITDSTLRFYTQNVSGIKALYPIPDLKITQCSSGEEEVEEEDSVTQEKMSPEPTDIPQSEEEPQAPEESFETVPISVICEVPSSKRVVETTAISPLSPPTSPAVSSPDSNMELTTAPSSSPVSGQTSELTTPASPSVAEVSATVVIHIPDLVSEQATTHPSATAPVASSTQIIGSPSPVIPASPHVSKNAGTPTPSEILISKPTPGPKPTPAPKPAVISKPTQETVPTPDSVSSCTLDSALQDLAQRPLAGAIHEPLSTAESATTDKQAVAPTIHPKVDHVKTPTTTVATPIIQSHKGPLTQTSVIVQMPNLVSPALGHPVQEQTPVSMPTPPSTAQMPDLVTSPSPSQSISLTFPVPCLTYAPLPAIVSAVDQAPISVPTMVSVSIPAKVLSTDQTSSAVEQVATPLSAQSSISALAKEIQPPTSVSIQIPIQRPAETRLHMTPQLGQAATVSPPACHGEHTAAKTVSVISPIVTTTVAFGASPSQPVQSMLTNIQERMVEIQNENVPDDGISSQQSVSQIISPVVQTQQGHVVVRLPNLENVAVKTTIEDGRGHPVIVSVSPFTYPATISSFITDSTVPPCVTSAKPHVPQERTDKPVISFPPPPPASPPELPYSAVPKADFNQQKSIPTPSSGNVTLPEPPPNVASVNIKPAVTHKSPPPVPPKPVCIPPGLVFSHRSRESVKPPVSPEPVVVQAVRAATLPRTREPPNALSLSLTAPVETKHSASSPKSPLSPRFARTLETYVVITLPSEPGSPVEGITTQAPMRRSSLPTPRQHVPSDAPRVFAPSAVDAPVSLISAQIVAAPPKPTSALNTAVPLEVMAPDFASVTIETHHITLAADSSQSIMEPCVTVPELPVASVQTFVSAPLVVASSGLSETMTVVPHITMENTMHSPSAFITPHVVMAPSALISAAPVAAPPPPPPPPISMEPTAYPAMTYSTPSLISPLAMAPVSVVHTSKSSEEVPVALAPVSGVSTESVPHYTVSAVQQELEMQQMQKTYSAPITVTQIPIPTQNEDIPGLDMEEILIVSASEEALTELGSSPVPITQLQEQQTVYEQKQEIPVVTSATTVPPVPVTFTQFTKSIESQEICRQDKVISSMSQVYSAISTTEQRPDALPNLVTQVVTTEVQRTTTVSVVQERIPVEPIPEPVGATITIQPEVHPKPKQNGKIQYPSDVIDLTTFKVNVTMTDQGMDLTAPDSSRSSLSSESSGRQATAVQPEIVNLSAEIIPTTTLSVVTDSITIVTCTATIAYNNNTVDKPLDLGNATSVPLPLTTYNPFEPLAQIVYRPVNSQPKATTSAEIPINLSYRAVASTAPTLMPVTIAPVNFTNGPVGIPIHTEPTAVGPVDLTTCKPMKTMVALSSSSGVVTTVLEDDGTPVDLTSGRRTVCCDVIYKLPFTGSCRTQPPVTIQPDNQIGYQIDIVTTPVTEDLRTMKASISDSNFKEAGLFSYERKNGFTYQNGASEGAIDLTSAKMSTEEALDYSKKSTLAFTGITTTPYSQGTSFGFNSLLRTTNGIVYSSVAAPVPSTYAITIQPGSIFSTTYNSLTNSTDPLSALPNQPAPYGFVQTTATDQSIFPQSDISKDILPSALASLLPSLTTFPELYSDATFEAIAASLDMLVSPNFPDLDDSKSQQYKAEHEFLQLEKLKQLCLAEELEWERQEIQRYREQEQIIVQKELEELQNMKQQLLMQQEEERKAHLILQQETFAQQQLQLEQIHRLQKQLQQQLQEQKIYPYGFGPSEGMSPPLSSDIIRDSKYSGGDNGQFWPVKDDNSTSSAVSTHDSTTGQNWLTTTSGAFTQYSSSIPVSVSAQTKDQLQLSTNLPDTAKQEQSVGLSGKKLIESGVQTDDEDGVEKIPSGRRRRSRRSVDSCVQTDDEDQDEWDIPVRSRRRSRSSRYADGEKGKSSKVSSIAIQTVAEISVQTEHSGTIRRSPVRAQVDTKVDLHREGQTESDSDITSDRDKRRPAPAEISVSTHLTAGDVGASLVTKSPKVLCSPVSPVSPGKSSQKMLTADSSRHLSSPRSLRASQRSLSDLKSLSPTTEDRMTYQYTDTYSSKGSQSGTPVGTQKKVKRTLPHPPPEEDTLIGLSGYTTASARRRMCRNTTMARAKILQDIDKELDLVERESSKLRKIQAELDEEEKEIDAKLRYLEMGINRRKEALLKEREKRERAYLQGVAEERDYMSDSEVSNIREARGNGHGLERPRTAPQSEFNQFIPPQTESESQYAQLTSPYSHYQYASQTSQYPQQTLYQQQSLYHQQVSPYQSIYSSVPSLNQQSQQTGYDHSSLLLMQQKPRQTTLSDLEPKITTNYEVVRNQPLLIVPTSTESAYGVSHLGGKYSSLDLRMGLEERASMASSPMSSISAESFYADLDHHNARNYVLIDDIGELTKSSTGLGSSFSIADKDISKADRLLRTADVHRTADVADFLGPLQAASRLHSYGKADEDSMEEPYELKMLKQQIKQEFRRGTDSLEQLTGLPHYLHSDTSFRHFPKAEKYSIGRLTLEKQAAKQLPASVLYQKQLKNKKALIDPKITKFSPIQESRDHELDYSSFLASASSVGGLSARARLLQDEITFGLRKNLAEQQKYLGSALGANLAQSLNFGQSLNLGPTIRSSLHDDGTYPSGTRSRPSSRPSSVYGLDLSIKRDLSNSSLRLKTEGEGIDSQFVSRAKPTSLPISQSRGRIPIVAQNSEEESPLSPVGQPMGMARASAGPLPPISADSRDQFGSSHSLPEVQQHMREESRTSGYERNIAFINDDLQGAMSDSEGKFVMRSTASAKARVRTSAIVHLLELFSLLQMKGSHYPFPHTRIKLQRDPKDHTISGSGLGIRVVGGKEIPGTNGKIGAYIAKVSAGGCAEHMGKVVEGMQVLEWNGIYLLGKTYEEVQSIVGQQYGEAEICVRLDLNMLSDTEHPQQLELHTQLRAGEHQRSPGIDPKQLAAELQKVSQQQAPASVLSALERAGHLHSGTGSAASSGVPSPGQPRSPSVNKKRHSSSEATTYVSHNVSFPQLQINYDRNMGNLIVHVLQARNLAPRENNGYTDPFVKVYLLPGRGSSLEKSIFISLLKKKTLEVTVWDYDRYSSNDFLGEVLIDLSNTAQLDNTPRWHPLKEQSESIHHGRTHPPKGPGQPGNQQSPKTSVIKSRSHGIFPDPAKDTLVPTIEKSHSSPGSSKSSSEGHLRSHGPSRSQSKGSVTQAHLEEAGNAIAAAEAAVQQARFQPNKTNHRMIDGDAYTLDSEENLGTNAVDSAIFQVPQYKYCIYLSIYLSMAVDKMMGEIKVALKKEMKTEGEQLVLEILQCRNITYKFKSPDHLPDLYVKLYVVNVATQKKIIKKKTRVCRHDREPSFNETFRFNLNPVGHSIQLFLVSNGGKFMKKTLIGEAYIWLDKVDMRKRAVSWHKLVATTSQTQP
uniref:Piccolo presynaptic cytomatrix protein b n=1 Tax=Sinocyclocheilus rhinocerous TaxID=307959 RepID=A0A673GY27_9TELE